MRRNPKGSGRAVLAALVALIVGVAVVPLETATAQPRRGGALTVGMTSEPRQLNPGLTVAWADNAVASKIFSGLLRFPEKGYPNPQPDLAERWAISADGRRVTFNLTKNAKWHDGTPFTADDVKFTFEEVLSKLHPNRIIYQSITRVDAPDPYTVIMERQLPFAFFHFDASGAPILPKHLYAGTDIAKNPYNLKPVGTGAFKFKSWTKGSHIEVVRNDDYFKAGKPYLDRVVFRFIPDISSVIAALEKGEVDYVPRWLPLSDVPRLKSRPGVEISSAGGIAVAQIRWMTFNMKDPIVKDVRVRQAIAYAIDVELVNQIATGGYFETAGSFLWKQYAEFDPQTSTLTAYKRDVQKAGKLLDEAGFRPGSGGLRFKLDLLTHAGVSDLDKTVEVIRNQLREVGIELTVKRVDRSLSFDLAKDGKFQLYIHSNHAGGPEPVTALQKLFSTENIGRLIGNSGSYSNPEVDQLTIRALAEADPRARKQIVHRLQEIWMKELPALPLQQWVPTSGHRGEFLNVVTHALDSRENLDEAWWVKGTAQ